MAHETRTVIVNMNPRGMVLLVDEFAGCYVSGWPGRTSPDS